MREEVPETTTTTTTTRKVGESAAAANRTRRDESVAVAAVGFRVCEVVLCVISFSIMAADKTRGWSGDSYDQYKEYRSRHSLLLYALLIRVYS